MSNNYSSSLDAEKCQTCPAFMDNIKDNKKDDRSLRYLACEYGWYDDEMSYSKHIGMFNECYNPSLPQLVRIFDRSVYDIDAGDLCMIMTALVCDESLRESNYKAYHGIASHLCKAMDKDNQCLLNLEYNIANNKKRKIGKKTNQKIINFLLNKC